jgi:ankyrin repeat protein
MQTTAQGMRRTQWARLWAYALPFVAVAALTVTGCENGESPSSERVQTEQNANESRVDAKNDEDYGVSPHAEEPEIVPLESGVERAISVETISSIRDRLGRRPAQATLSPRDIVVENDVEQLLGFIYWERNPNWENEHGEPILLMSARMGRIELVENLLRYGAEVDREFARNRMTPLMAAVRAGHIDVAHLLIENGANVNHRGGIDGNMSLLDLAERLGNVEMVAFLIEMGAKD